MAFAYEALDPGGRQIKGVIDAASVDEATRQLHARNLFVTRVSGGDDPDAAAEIRSSQRGPLLAGRAGSTRDLLMLAQQMTMMLRAGSRVVPALEAIAEQINKPAWRKVIDEIREQVEAGSPLNGAIANHPHIFDQGWQAIIAAGESTGQLAEAFERLSAMAKQQQQIRSKLVGAIAYPAVLMCVSMGVLSVLMFFVLPRFDNLYTMLDTPLPGMTAVLMRISRWMLAHKLLVLLAAGVVVGGPIGLLQMRSVRRRLDELLIGLPVVGPVARQILLARIFRIWGTAVRSSVPLLESLELARGAIGSAVYQGLLDDLIEAIEEGNTIQSVLAGHPLVPRTMASAIGTGEQSGQLSDSLLFLAAFMEEENAQSLATLTRLIEPIILVVLGVTVGTVAISLFLPLFDLTSAAR